MHLEDDTIGVLIEMKVREAAHDRSPAIVGEYPAANQHSTDTAGGLLPGRSLIWKRTCREIATVRVLPEPVLVVGERGTGKTNAAKLLAGDGQGPVETLDAALATHAGRDWVASARRKLINRGRLVVTHLDALPADLQNALAALLREAEGFGGRLVATGDRSVGSACSAPRPTPLCLLWPRACTVTRSGSPSCSRACAMSTSSPSAPGAPRWPAGGCPAG